MDTTQSAAEKELLLIWQLRPDSRTLSQVRTERADDQIRDHVRLVPGPQPYKHNYYTDGQFHRHTRERGVVENLYGQRVARLGDDFLSACLEALDDEVGDAAAAIMYRMGHQWGLADMRTFAQRAQAEYEVELGKMGMGFLLETWWWPMASAGWGTWRYDFRQAKQGLLYVDLRGSTVAESLGAARQPVCHLYGGLFSAVFSVLAKRCLDCVEIQCKSMGAEECRFLISTGKRVSAATFWRNEGASSADIQAKIAAMG